MTRLSNKYEFYRRLLVLAIPMMIQQGITNFVNLLDGIMVGRLGTTQMTGVAVANQMVFIVNLCIFGSVTGAGIFAAQYFGKGDFENLKNTFKFKLIFSFLMTGILCLLIFAFGQNFASIYLKGEGSKADAQASLDYAVRYIRIILIGMIPYAISQSFSSSLRETNNSVVPMISGIIAVFVNLVLNYLLIFGMLGFPKLGVRGAAIATVVSRFVELVILIGYTVKNKLNCPFFNGAFKTLKIPLSLVKNITAKSVPLMANETLWAVGIALFDQSLSLKSLDVVAALNISDTFFRFFSVSFHALAGAIGIIVGQEIGAGNEKTVMSTAKRLISFQLIFSIFIGILFGIVSRFIPALYNTTDSVRSLSYYFMIVTAVWIPLDSFALACYFVIRSGGKTLVTMIFDSGFECLVALPTVFLLVRYTSLAIVPIYAIAMGATIIKDVAGYILVNKGHWIKTL